MAFLTPRETAALAALVQSGPISIADLSLLMSEITGKDIGPEATTALARSLVGQSMAERSGAADSGAADSGVGGSGAGHPDRYRATTEGRAWLVANTNPEAGAICGYSAEHKLAGTPAVAVIDAGVAGIVPACAACADSDAELSSGR